ncbi:MAG: hypothetical protein E7646_00325 [Ruminococcaceae bacterium]|nr:hypothetical protein [Oscillospiraceae bacterium]
MHFNKLFKGCKIYTPVKKLKDEELMKSIQCLGGVVAVRKTLSNNITYCLVRSIAQTEEMSGECFSLAAWKDDSVAFYFDVCRDLKAAFALFEKLADAQISPAFLGEVLEEL